MDATNETTRPLAVVTGATGGLGAEFVRQLAGSGYRVLATARSEDRLRALGKELALGDQQYAVRAADLARAGDVLGLAEHLSSEPVDLLVNNAGFGSYGKFADADLEGELREARVNMLALMELTHAVLPGMLARHRGEVINVGSIAGYQPVPRMATYGATKAFVQSFSHALAGEVHGSGVTVTCLNPGPVDTGFFDVAGSHDAQAGQMLAPGEVVAKALSAARKGRQSVTPGAVNTVMGAVSAMTPATVSARIAAWTVRPRSSHARS